jgi:RNA polymerase sigma-70 factor (ECF subfamily)
MKVHPFTPADAALPHAAWDDAALTRALTQDSEPAFAAIYDRYWAALHAQARRKLQCPHEAEEVVQDVFVALWHKRHTAAIDHLERYLFAALKYRVIDCIRARLVRENYAAGAPARPGTFAADSGTEDTVAAADLAAALAASVSRLPDHARQVFRLSRLEHRSVPEIAAQLQVSPKTVEYHLARSLKLLRARLREFLVSAVLLVAGGF